MSSISPRALVTGGAQRVGRAICLALANEGYDVAVHYRRSRSEAEALAAEIERLGRRSSPFAADLAHPGAASVLAETVSARFGPLDLLVLSASSYPRESLAALEESNFVETLQTNLVAPVFLARHVGLDMKARGRGHIVSLLDWSIDRPDPHYLAYQASKAALREMTYGLARTLAPEVRVNGIAPGAVLLPEGTSPQRADAVRAKTLVGHLGSPEDVARAVLYLLGAEHFVTGTVLRVDGGRALL